MDKAIADLDLTVIPLTLDQNRSAQLWPDFAEVGGLVDRRPNAYSTSVGGRACSSTDFGEIGPQLVVRPIDSSSTSNDNSGMSTEAIHTSDPLKVADTQAVLDHLASHEPIPHDVNRRVQERAAKIKEDIRKRGVTNVAVDLIREARDQ